MQNHHRHPSTTGVHPSLHRLITDARAFAEDGLRNSRPMPFRLTVETPNRIFGYTLPCPRHDLIEFHRCLCASHNAGKRVGAASRASGVAIIYELFRFSAADDGTARGKQFPPPSPEMEVIALQAESHEEWTDMVLEVLRDTSGQFTGICEVQGASRTPPDFGLLQAKPSNADERSEVLRTRWRQDFPSSFRLP